MKEITEAEPAQNPLAILGQMDLQTIDPDKVEKLLAVQERWEDRQASKAFAVALAEFQAECPTIRKTKPVHTKNGQKAFDYAPYEVIKHVVQPFMTKHGFSSTVDQVQDENPATATAVCTIRHSSGHSEKSTYSVPVGQPNQLTDAAKERVKATTIARRQAFLCGFDIACEDQDAQYYNDPPEPPAEPVTPEQAAELDQLLIEFDNLAPGKKRYALFANKIKVQFGAESFEELPAEQFEPIKAAILGKLEEAK